ncbi:MAG TPA: D-alanyl-D-alanine carboxypeptidase, partial [bacterium]|nr:D-alanyl-D-alanine carboxypeptidase [bacterium]
NGTVSKKNIPGNLKNYFRFYSSETLESLIQKLNKYSNNFMIYQIFLYIGALKTQAPANLSKSVIVFKEIFKNDRILNDIEIEEASGLSRQNKISCAQSNYVLKLFEQYKKLLPERVGGLFKTGTLNGVYSISGYYNSKKYGDVYITIILNQQRNTRQKILDELLKLID